MQIIQGVLVDEKFLGSIQGFVTVCLDATTSEQFNEVMNGIRYRINSAHIESTNAAIKRIQAKACCLFDLRYLFLKLRQVYFLRLQRKHKTSRFFYQQI